MKILITDTNILIDLIKMNLLNECSNLLFELFTTDFILEELHSNQKTQVQELIDAEQIKLIVTSKEADFEGINELLSKSSGLSFEDCSVWYYSKKMTGTLITGDRRLRKLVEKDGIEVRGIIYLLDEILKQRLISFQTAIKKIELLYRLNSRLPKEELKLRVKAWKNEKEVSR